MGAGGLYVNKAIIFSRLLRSSVSHHVGVPTGCCPKDKQEEQTCMRRSHIGLSPLGKRIGGDVPKSSQLASLALKTELCSQFYFLPPEYTHHTQLAGGDLTGAAPPQGPLGRAPVTTRPEPHSPASRKTRLEPGLAEDVAAGAPQRGGISQDEMPETLRMLALSLRLQAGTVSQRQPNLDIVHRAHAGPGAQHCRTKPSVGDARPSQATPSQTPPAAP